MWLVAYSATIQHGIGLCGHQCYRLKETSLMNYYSRETQITILDKLYHKPSSTSAQSLSDECKFNIVETQLNLNYLVDYNYVVLLSNRTYRIHANGVQVIGCHAKEIGLLHPQCSHPDYSLSKEQA